MRFSAPLARFCRIRCHQRRARRAELASFSVFVSNLDFRVPRLRPNRRTGADRAVRRRKRGHPRGPESRPGLPQRSGLARSGPSDAWASLLVPDLACQQVSGPSCTSSPAHKPACHGHSLEPRLPRAVTRPGGGYHPVANFRPGSDCSISLDVSDGVPRIQPTGTNSGSSAHAIPRGDYIRSS